jgi:hypothetical protein
VTVRHLSCAQIDCPAVTFSAPEQRDNLDLDSGVRTIDRQYVALRDGSLVHARVRAQACSGHAGSSDGTGSCGLAVVGL